MISDVLSDAVSQIRRYLSDEAEMYAPFSAEIGSTLREMDGLRRKLDEPPTARPADRIKQGLEDALAFAKGDETRATELLHDTRGWLRSKGVESLIDSALSDGITIAALSREVHHLRMLLADLLKADSDGVFGDPCWGEREAALWKRVQETLKHA